LAERSATGRAGYLDRLVEQSRPWQASDRADQPRAPRRLSWGVGLPVVDDGDPTLPALDDERSGTARPAQQALTSEVTTFAQRADLDRAGEPVGRSNAAAALRPSRRGRPLEDSAQAGSATRDGSGSDRESATSGAPSASVRFDAAARLRPAGTPTRPAGYPTDHQPAPAIPAARSEGDRRHAHLAQTSVDPSPGTSGWPGLPDAAARALALLSANSFGALRPGPIDATEPADSARPAEAVTRRAAPATVPAPAAAAAYSASTALATAEHSGESAPTLTIGTIEVRLSPPAAPAPPAPPVHVAAQSAAPTSRLSRHGAPYGLGQV
jgi:hypothetical protein